MPKSADQIRELQTLCNLWMAAAAEKDREIQQLRRRCSHLEARAAHQAQQRVARRTFPLRPTGSY
ncbi:MAG: hypothetical protein H6707_09930 [Deltaproteobacteria bacterium]|nr:hypothetical protein [Deltaproteobacteria bacterium]